MSIQWLKIVFTVFIGLISLNSMAFERGKVNVNSGIGLFGSRGFLGVSADKFFNENEAFSAALGLDNVGITLTGGYKYFGLDKNKADSESLWNKCFFLFTCEDHMYYGASFQYVTKMTAIDSFENGTKEYSYSQGNALLGMLSWGIRTVYTSKITMDLELTARQRLIGGEFKQISGEPREKNMEELLGLLVDKSIGLGMGLGVGYLF